MTSFWKQVNSVLKTADLIIEVLDARMIDESRNVEIEHKINRNGKRILYVLTKCDLVDINELKKVKLYPSVFISSKDKLGTTILKKKIMELSRGEEVTVGVVGYPNVGKSSLINALSGRGSARTSAQSSFTRGIQKIRVSPKITLLDTPGVFPKQKEEEFKRVKMGAIDYGKVKDPETAALKLIEEKTKMICKYYHIEESDDLEEMLERIAFSLNKLIKKGQADISSTSRLILKDWQTGKIKSN